MVVNQKYYYLRPYFICVNIILEFLYVFVRSTKRQPINLLFLNKAIKYLTIPLKRSLYFKFILVLCIFCQAILLVLVNFDTIFIIYISDVIQNIYHNQKQKEETLNRTKLTHTQRQRANVKLHLVPVSEMYI